MKKILTLISIPLLYFSVDAQLALALPDNTPITDGQVITYNSLDDTVATLHYKIKNTSASPINVRIKVQNLVNTTGSQFQFCYLTSCLPFVTLNAIYPSNSNSAIGIPANSETDSVGYNMWNSNPGNGTYPLDYTFKYYMVNGFNSEIGTPVSFTYRYTNSAMSVDDLQKQKDVFVIVNNTIVDNQISVTSKEKSEYSIYQSNGQVLKRGTIGIGTNTLDASSLVKGIYFIQIKGNNGNIFIQKVLK